MTRLPHSAPSRTALIETTPEVSSSLTLCYPSLIRIHRALMIRTHIRHKAKETTTHTHTDKHTHTYSQSMRSIIFDRILLLF